MDNGYIYRIFVSMKKKILYSAVVLDDASKQILLNTIKGFEGWTPFAHHMTIGFKKSLKDLGLKEHEGNTISLAVLEIGESDKAVAVRVSGLVSKNTIPHVTVYTNPKTNGKPFDSNKITNWIDVESLIILKGVVKNIYQ